TQEGQEIKLQPGDNIAKQGDPPDGFYIILAGKTEWTRTVEGQEVHAVTLQAGEVFAELILLLDEPYPTNGKAVTEVCLYKLDPDAFWQMLTLCPSVLRGILKISTERSQIHESVTQQQAKLISLGTLSAGLAHELNNPAAAIARGVSCLEEVLRQLPTLALKLHEQPIGKEQLTFLSSLYQQTTEAAKNAPQLDPLAKSEAEDALTDWLEEQNVEKSWQLAPTLVNAGLDTGKLEEVATKVNPECLGKILTWLEATLSGMFLLEEIQQSTEKISELIKAMKDYSYRDQAPLQKIDIHQGIETTLTILKHKLKYGMTVKREYGDLPPIFAYAPQLNQVWTNLIDNAIDATDGQGTIWIRTSLEGDRVLVEIADNGAGIPSDIEGRVFEQFFTTKEVGKGTGLGLDIVRRIVEGQHKGSIRVISQPGDTRFLVYLPIDLCK
ncbi:MAG: ATP-binding protein, partial [Spirulinaceae cyanobacterium]